WIDAGGALALGPHSAGAAPGPVCYGLGGAEPTVTDANVVLGRIDPGRFLGGTMPLDAGAAARAVDEALAGPLGLSRDAAAAGVVRLADVTMALAVRGITTARGLDPREDAPVLHRAVDLRYLGQEHTVTVSVTELGDWPGLRRQFDHAHERAYGYAAADVDVQLLNLRLTLIRPLEPPRLPVLDRRRAGAPAFETRKVHSMTAGD